MIEHAIGDRSARLLFYCHDTYGLGHLRRTLALATHLRGRWPATSQLIVTGSPVAQSFPYPPGADYVKLPAVVKTGETVNLPASARLYADDRGARRVASKKLRQLLDRAARTHPAPPIERATYLPGLRALIQLWPVDYDLPALPRATSPAILGPHMPSASHAELIRYKPAHKALFRYEADDGEGSAVYGKLLPDDRGAVICSLGHALRGQGVPTPEPLAYLPSERLQLHAAAPGRSLASLRGDPAYRDALGPTAEALACLHASTHPALSFNPDHERAAIDAAARAVATLVPHLASRAERLAHGLAVALDSLPTACATVHGDFYDDQVLVAPDGVTLIDLDEVRLGHPLLDVGNFLAHLTAAGDPHDARLPFLDAYRHHQPASDRDVALFEATGLLKLAVRPFRRLDPDWPAGVESTLALAEQRWRDSQVSRIPVGVDPSLPQLPILMDSMAMADRLSREVYGVPVGILDTALVRHKPGRRAIVRYDLIVGADGDCRWERLYGKTFALERELEPLAARVERLGTRAPTLEPAASRCLALIELGRSRPWRWRWRPIHRDLYHDQILAGTHGLAILDFDDAAISEPAVDVANFLAHLRLLAFKRPEAGDGPARAAAAFADSYRSLEPDLDLGLVRFLEGATLLRLAEIHQPRAGSDRIASRLLATSEELLQATASV